MENNNTYILEGMYRGIKLMGRLIGELIKDGKKNLIPRLADDIELTSILLQKYELISEEEADFISDQSDQEWEATRTPTDLTHLAGMLSGLESLGGLSGLEGSEDIEDMYGSSQNQDLTGTYGSGQNQDITGTYGSGQNQNLTGTYDSDRKNISKDLSDDDTEDEWHLFSLSGTLDKERELKIKLLEVLSDECEDELYNEVATGCDDELFEELLKKYNIS